MLLHSELESHVAGNGPIYANSLPEEIKKKMDDAYKGISVTCYKNFVHKISTYSFCKETRSYVWDIT